MDRSKYRNAPRDSGFIVHREVRCHRRICDDKTRDDRSEVEDLLDRGGVGCRGIVQMFSANTKSDDESEEYGWPRKSLVPIQYFVTHERDLHNYS